MTEPSILLEAAKQVPALVVLCYVVWMFLGKLTLFIDGLKTMQKEHIGAISSMTKEHLDARAQSREALRDNTEAMKQNTQAMSALIEEVTKRHV